MGIISALLTIIYGFVSYLVYLETKGQDEEQFKPNSKWLSRQDELATLINAWLSPSDKNKKETTTES